MYMQMSKRHNRGFTLFELMVTVAIIAILTTLAASSYNSAMAKSDRSIAIADLNDITLTMSRFYSANRVYTDDFKDLNMAAATQSTISDPQQYYNYTLSTQNTNANYLIEAAPNAKSRDKWALRLTDKGVKTRKLTSSATWETGWP